jgi:hypothetical protein
MTTAAVVMLVVVLVCTDLVVVGALFSHLRSSMWKPLSDAFPARPPAADAVRKEFQSISIGVFNLGLCAHLTVDDDCLHIDPAALLRWFRMTGMSIPWEAVRLRKRSRFFKQVTVRIRNADITGPSWAFGLAEPM